MNEAHERVAAIFADAGWTPGTKTGWDRFVWCDGVTLGGIDPWGVPRATGIVANPSEGPSTLEEAARWLVAHAKALANPLATDATLEPITLAEPPEAEETPQHESSVSDNPGGGGSEGLADERGHSDWNASEHQADEPGAERDGALASDADPIDADFSEPQDLGAELLDEHEAELPALEGADVEPEAPAQDGPIAYGASTIDGLIREKLGRVSQIARELKAVQQEGWTVEEYAYLQNLIVRMDRGEAPDDQASRDRFLDIARKSQAMSRIDAVRDRKEGELEDIGQRRDFDAAVYYEPEADWP